MLEKHTDGVVYIDSIRHFSCVTVRIKQKLYTNARQKGEWTAFLSILCRRHYFYLPLETKITRQMYDHKHKPKDKG